MIIKGRERRVYKKREQKEKFGFRRK